MNNELNKRMGYFLQSSKKKMSRVWKTTFPQNTRYLNRIIQLCPKIEGQFFFIKRIYKS